MECAICYEKFFIPKTKEEFENMYNKNVQDNNLEQIMKFTNLLITSKHNTSYKCPTPNCNCIICENCWIKIKHNVKDIDEILEYENKYNYNYFKCPYCIQIDWKEYMNNVFVELQKKILPEDIFLEETFKRIFPEFK